MIDKPLYQNPLGGGPATLIPNPGAGTVPKGGLTAEMQMSNAGMKIDPFGVRLRPQADMPKILGEPLRPKSDDPLVQGYMDSDFYSNISTTNVVPYTYKGKEVQGSGSYASNFKKYLESIGKGDLIQFPDQEIAQQGSGPLATVGPNVGNEIVPYNPDAGPGVGLDGKPILDGTPSIFPLPNNNYTRSVQPIVSGPETFEIATQQAPNQFNDQFSSMGDRLTKLEEGIASLLNQNGGFGFNSMQPKFGAPNYGYSPFSMTGLGSLFGGYYG